MSTTPRKHHYIPQCYLKRFTEKNFVTVIGIKDKNVFRAKPAEIAHERDFFRVELPEVGEDPNLLEKQMALGEDQFSAVIDSVENNLALPASGSIELEILLSGFAKMHVMAPDIREQAANMQSDILKKKLQETFCNPAQVSALSKSMGINLEDEGLSAEELFKFSSEGKYTIRTDRTHEILLMLAMFEPTLRQLLRRQWSLGIVDNLEFRLITSDMPTAILSNRPGIPATIETGVVTIALTPILQLVGDLAAHPSRFSVSKTELAIGNNIRLLYAPRHAFASTAEVLYLRERKLFSHTFELGSIEDFVLPYDLRGDIRLHSYLNAQEKLMRLRTDRRKHRRQEYRSNV